MKMEVELLACGQSYIRSGNYLGTTGYVMMDVMGFVNTSAKSSEIAKKLNTNESFRCAINGIPGRPNICVTLSGIERICKTHNLLTQDLIEFVASEKEKEVHKAPPVVEPAIEEFKELLPVVEQLDLLLKINKRLKKIEKMMSELHEELK